MRQFSRGDSGKRRSTKVFFLFVKSSLSFNPLNSKWKDERTKQTKIKMFRLFISMILPIEWIRVISCAVIGQDYNYYRRSALNEFRINGIQLKCFCFCSLGKADMRLKCLTKLNEVNSKNYFLLGYFDVWWPQWQVPSKTKSIFIRNNVIFSHLETHFESWSKRNITSKWGRRMGRFRS